MAKPKENFVALSSKVIIIWVSTPERVIPKIKEIEGTTIVRSYLSEMIHAFVDPCYDAEEVEAEIRDLLDSEVPDIFREEK